MFTDRDDQVVTWDVATRRATFLRIGERPSNFVSPRAPQGWTTARPIGTSARAVWFWFDSVTPPVIGVQRSVRRIGVVDSLGEVLLVGDMVPGPETFRGEPGPGGFAMIAESPLAAAPIAAHCDGVTLIGDTHQG